MIKLDNHNRTLNSIIKRILVSETPDPAEIGLVEPVLCLLQPNPTCGFGKIEKVLLQDGDHEFLLCSGHGGDEDSLVGNNPIIAVCAAYMALVVVVPAAVRHCRVAEEFEDLGGGLLGWG